MEGFVLWGDDADDGVLGLVRCECAGISVFEEVSVSGVRVGCGLLKRSARGEGEVKVWFNEGELHHGEFCMTRKGVTISKVF